MRFFVSKKEASHYPFIGKAVKLLECKFLDRNDLKQQVKVILDVKNLLMKSKEIGVFIQKVKEIKIHILDY